jgi:hypothetical protein
MKKLFSLLTILILSHSLKSQNIPNPYASIGKPAPKVATLTNGAYDEFFIKDSLVLINNDAISRKTGDIVFSKEEHPEIIAQLIKNEEDKFRFLSIDPISHQYPELTPYQFASNRPIDGIDLDGLEYATFTIFVQQNGIVKDIKITKDYELKAKNTLGPGVLYNYAYLDKNGRIEKFDAKPLVTNLHGIYQGGDNPKVPKKGQHESILEDNYDLEPIDETDATAKQHDLDYDKESLAGFDGIMDPKSKDANEKYIKSAEKIISKYKNKENDKITGKPVTKETADAANFGKNGFKAAEYVKGVKERSKIIDVKFPEQTGPLEPIRMNNEPKK